MMEDYEYEIQLRNGEGVGVKPCPTQRQEKTGFKQEDSEMKTARQEHSCKNSG